MVDEKASHLLRVLKDISKDEVITKLNEIRENNDTQIGHLFLQEYFRNKDVDISPEIYQYEAQCIVDIFPQYSVEYIESMLETLGSENNRVVIILRQLLKNEPINNLVLPQQHQFSKKDIDFDFAFHTPHKKPRRNVEEEQDYMFPQPTTSGAFDSKCDTTSNNGLDLKKEMSALLKRKSNENQEPRPPKIKVIPTAAVGLIAENKKNFIIPETCTSYSRFNNTSTFAYPKNMMRPLSPNPSSSNFHDDMLDMPLLDDVMNRKVREENKPPPANAFTEKQVLPANYLRSFSQFLDEGPLAPPKKENPQSNLLPDLDDILGLHLRSSQAMNNVANNSLDKYFPHANQKFNTPVVTEPFSIPGAEALVHNYFHQINPETKTRVPQPINDVPAQNVRPVLWDTFPDLALGDELNNIINTKNTSTLRGPQTVGDQQIGTYNNSQQHIVNMPLPTANDTYVVTPTKTVTFRTNGLPKPDENLFEISSEDERDNDYDDDFESLSNDSTDDEINGFTITKLKDLPHNTPAKCNKANDTSSNTLISKMMEMFPDATPTYIKQLCTGRKASPTDVDTVLQIILSNPDYPKKKQRPPSPDPDLDLEEQIALLKEILPDADPNYLQYHAELYINDKDKLREFTSNALELKNYPTMKEYLRKQQLSAQVKQYTTEFKVEKFLELIPDPHAYFTDPNRKSTLIQNNGLDFFSLHYATGFLKNQYPMVSVKTINAIMAKHKDNLVAAVQELEDLVKARKGLMKSRRKAVSIDSTIQNIPLLQEIAYLKHKEEIKNYLAEKEAKEKLEKELAKQEGLLRTCNCCYNDEVMPKNIVECGKGCDFCNECVKTSAEILFGEGKLEFPCLQSCSAFFSLQTLKDVLTPKMFSKMAQRKQLEEVKAAGIEELEMCPFCDFATIPAPEDKLFRCLNPECMKESCRQCKEPSHVPLRCDEIEKDDDIKRRTYIENKMTEALVRVCYKCGTKFIKADGCNKMTCNCGATMCYVCGQPVKDYKHFNGQGGDKYHLCPLYSDTNQLHKDDVIKGAEIAKAEIGVAGDPKKLKIDPTADLHQHYKNKKPKVAANHILPIYGEVEAVRVRIHNLHRQLYAAARERMVDRRRHRRHHGHHHHHSE